jgi:hypothetical protein
MIPAPKELYAAYMYSHPIDGLLVIEERMVMAFDDYGNAMVIRFDLGALVIAGQLPGTDGMPVDARCLGVKAAYRSIRDAE